MVDSRERQSAPDVARDEAIIHACGLFVRQTAGFEIGELCERMGIFGKCEHPKAVDQAPGDRTRIIWDSFRGSQKRHGPSTYTDMRLADAEASVRGDGADSNAIAAVQAAAGQWARAFAVATVEPAVPATRMLTAGVLHDLGRSLVLQGEAVYLIDQAGGELQLLRAADWDIYGGVRSWTYRLTLSGPSGTMTRRVPAAGVLHPRGSTRMRARHYKGQSPVALAGLTAGLAAHIEKSLRSEAKSNTGICHSSSDRWHGRR